MLIELLGVVDNIGGVSITCDDVGVLFNYTVWSRRYATTGAVLTVAKITFLAIMEMLINEL